MAYFQQKRTINLTSYVNCPNLEIRLLGLFKCPLKVRLIEKKINRLHNVSGLLVSAAKKASEALNPELIDCQNDADKIWETIFCRVY